MAYYARVLLELTVETPPDLSIKSWDEIDIESITWLPTKEKIKELIQKGELPERDTTVEETPNYRIQTTKFATQAGAQEWVDFVLSQPGSIFGEVIEI